MTIVTKSHVNTIIICLEVQWIPRHGLPTALSADGEFNRKNFLDPLEVPRIELKVKPLRCHKHWNHRKKNSAVREILGMLALDDKNSQLRWDGLRVTSYND